MTIQNDFKINKKRKIVGKNQYDCILQVKRKRGKEKPNDG